MRLQSLAEASADVHRLDKYTVEYCFEIFRRHLRAGSILELGAADGFMTQHLVEVTSDLVCVDGAEHFCRQLQSRFPDAQVVCSLFAELEPGRRFNNVILGHVLEHVEDPVDLLRRAKRWLKEDGRLFAAVPNARSIHRQAAVDMSLLASEDAMNDSDVLHGHRRVYRPDSFKQDFIDAGYNVEVFGGYWLKPLSNSQMTFFTPEMFRAFMRLGERYPDIAAESYIVATCGDK